MGKGYSLQGTKDYSHPIKSKRWKLEMTTEQLEVFLKEGICINSKKLRPEVLVRLLCSHVLEFYNSQVAWKDLVVFVSDKARVNIPIIAGTSKCGLEAFRG